MHCQEMSHEIDIEQFCLYYLPYKFLDYSQFLSEARVNLELVSNSYHEATSTYP